MAVNALTLDALVTVNESSVARLEVESVFRLELLVTTSELRVARPDVEIVLKVVLPMTFRLAAVRSPDVSIVVAWRSPRSRVWKSTVSEASSVKPLTCRLSAVILAVDVSVLTLVALTTVSESKVARPDEITLLSEV